jgi:uracil-DNA glycosylase family 4
MLKLIKLEQKIIDVLKLIKKNFYLKKDISISKNLLILIQKENKKLVNFRKILLKQNFSLDYENYFKKFKEVKPKKKLIKNNNKIILWKKIQYEVLNSSIFKKNSKGGKIVFGVGNLNTNLLFCGEAPGEKEEKIGIPFVGKAGLLFNKILRAMNINRDHVYITNAVNWRPKNKFSFNRIGNNRPPTQNEIDFCYPYLKKQIDIIQPKIIVALGLTAFNSLLKIREKIKMSDVEGKWFLYKKNIFLIGTYHPSYLLRNRSIKIRKVVWNTMIKIMKKLNLKITQKQTEYFQ